MRSIAAAAALVASASATLLNIHNWGSQDNVMWIDGGEQVTIPANSVLPYELLPGVNHNLKMATSPDGNPMYTNNIMQFEYSFANGQLAWDLSMINGNPFGAGNVKVTPVGNGANDPQFPMCTTLSCPANQVCPGAYQPSSAYNAAGLTRPCPDNVDILWLDLWEPDGQFKKRSVAFSA